MVDSLRSSKHFSASARALSGARQHFSFLVPVRCPCEESNCLPS
jgi:hypothetical protein